MQHVTMRAARMLPKFFARLAANDATENCREFSGLRLTILQQRHLLCSKKQVFLLRLTSSCPTLAEPPNSKGTPNFRNLRNCSNSAARLQVAKKTKSDLVPDAVVWAAHAIQACKQCEKQSGQHSVFFLSQRAGAAQRLGLCRRETT